VHHDTRQLLPALNLINNLALKLPRELVSGLLGIKPFAQYPEWLFFHLSASFA
jgi:hypothetical protein